MSLTFSVIIPTHNRPNTLMRLLHTLEAQEIPSHTFEIFIVPSPNDVSIKDIQKYITSSSLKINILIPDPDPYSGKSASFKRNFAAQRAQAPWLAFIDDDCTAHSQWLSSALPLTQDSDIHGIEGNTQIPKPPKKTLTYKGITNLSRPQGYQTCNIFYRRDLFIELGGFDLNFPFYLEDTDLAWTFLDHKKKIVFSEKSIVEHPVPPPEVYRLITGAIRARKLPLLYKKHRTLFSINNQPIPRSHKPYLVLYVLLFFFMISGQWALSLFVFASLFFLATAHTIKLFWGCSFSIQEIFLVWLYNPVVPLISLVQLIRGNIEHKVFIL